MFENLTRLKKTILIQNPNPILAHLTTWSPIQPTKHKTYWPKCAILAQMCENGLTLDGCLSSGFENLTKKKSGFEIVCLFSI